MLTPSNREDDLSPASFSQLQQIGQQFEAAFRSGQSPRIEDFLRQAPAQSRRTWLRELVLRELRCLQQRGEPLREEEYRQRFPQDADTIRDCFTALHSAGTASSDEGGPDEEKRTLLLERHVAGVVFLERLGRYRIVRPLRHGTRVVVYLAHDEERDRPVQVQVMRQAQASTPVDVERFGRAARALAELSHPNLCPIHEVGQHQGIPYFITGHIEGQSLADRIQAGPPFTPRQAAETVRKLAQVLHAVHQKEIIHRDLTSEAVVLSAEKEPVLVDVGLARRLQAETSRLTQAGEVVGSPGYLAPELLRGDSQTQGPAGDVFALGVLLYEMLTGALPFGRTLPEVLRKIGSAPVRPSSLRAEGGRGLETIYRKAMAASTSQRYASMLALADDLGRYLARLEPGRASHPAGITASGSGPGDGSAFTPLPYRRASRKWTWLVGGALLSVLSLAALAWLRGYKKMTHPGTAFAP